MTRSLAAVQVVSYPVLVWLVWVWLGIAESSALELAGSALLGLSIVVAIAWLLATAFEGSLRVPPSTMARSLVFAGVCSILIGAMLWLRPRQIYWICVAVVIAALLPLHFARTWRVLRDWRYWVACLLLVLLGGYAPWKVVSWVPAAKTLPAQATSMGIRFTIAYLFTVAALLAFAVAVRRLAAVPTPPTRAA